MEKIALVCIIVTAILLLIQIIMDINLTRKQYKYFMKLRSEELDEKRKVTKKNKRTIGTDD